MRLAFAALALGAGLLAGCENQVTEGIRAEVIAEGHNGSAPMPVTAADASTVQTPASTHDEFAYRTSDGMKIEFEYGALNFSVVSVNKCPSVATLLRRFGDFVLPGAYAHGAAVETNGGGVNVLSEEGADLGEVDLTPGTYCSATFAITPGTQSMPD